MKKITNDRLVLLETIAILLVPHELATLAYSLVPRNVYENRQCGINLKNKNEMRL